MSKIKISKRNKSIAIGLICGLLCAVCVGIYIAQVDEQANAAQKELLAKYGGDQIDVCVAKRDIMAGETILDGDVETRTWIATMLPANAIVDKKEAVGKKLGSTIFSGEVISSSRFGFDNASIEVPDGLVAVSVPTRDVQAVGGALETGMMTDVYSVGATTTSRIARNVQVLATSAGSERTAASTDSWVTLAVQPAIVRELVTAIETAQIYFVLPSASVTEAESELSNLPNDANSGQSDSSNGDGVQAGDSQSNGEAEQGQSIQGNAQAGLESEGAVAQYDSDANSDGAQ